MSFYKAGLNAGPAASPKQVVGADVAGIPVAGIAIALGLLGATYGVDKSRTRARRSRAEATYKRIAETTHRHPGGYKAKGRVIDV